ncbi:MAG: metal-dependent hydrolase [Methanolobus sp.]
MVNTLSHLGIGLLIASVAGLNSRQIKIVAFMAILPDLDFIFSVFLMAIDQNLNHEMYNTLYYLFGHREFMHSLIFALIVVMYVWFRERNRILIIASAAAILSHVYLDYVTSWKMRPFFPFVTDASTIGAIDFFDPVVTIVSFVPIYYILVARARKKSVDNGKSNWFQTLTTGSHRKMYTRFLIVFTLWCLLNPFAKVFLISDVETSEDTDISYQNSYPVSPGKFLSAYRYDDGNYKILLSSYWSGVEKSDLIRIYPENSAESMPYIKRTGELYASSLPKEIDYPVYNVSSSGANVTVTISDARNPYARFWAYFKTEYIFVFETDSETYHAYYVRDGQQNRSISSNVFE